MKKAFTLSEALLTMTILGIIAAVMVTTLKPGQYKAQAFRTLRAKAYTVVDEATQSILADCTTGTSLAKIHENCNRRSATHAFGTGENALYALYLRGDTGGVGVANGTCLEEAGFSSLKLRNGICLYFQNQSTGIKVDVNGNEGPNELNMDQFTISLSDDEGVSSDMP